MPLSRRRATLGLVAWGASTWAASRFEAQAYAGESEPNRSLPRFQQLDPKTPFVPPRLLPLAHAAEVQAELELEGKRLDTFVALLRDVDGPWWRSRNRPVDEQRKIIAEQETRFTEGVAKRLGASTLERLRQLELQAQGFRCLSRPEVATHLGLSDAQSKRLAALFAASDDAEKGKHSEPAAKERLEKARQAEAMEPNAILTNEQKGKLKAALGKLVDTNALERVYPLAPELIDSGAWQGVPVKLAAWKGQVVLLHFYAFQCHNCQANFDHYRRWQKELAGKGGKVVGIQTPETAAEGDAKQVRAAATDQGFEFPVLIDLKRANWDAWGNTMWPTVYVIDKQGYIRMWWQGELNWRGADGDKRIDTLVEKLLAEK